MTLISRVISAANPAGFSVCVANFFNQDKVMSNQVIFRNSHRCNEANSGVRGVTAAKLVGNDVG